MGRCAPVGRRQRSERSRPGDQRWCDTRRRVSLFEDDCRRGPSRAGGAPARCRSSGSQPGAHIALRRRSDRGRSEQAGPVSARATRRAACRRPDARLGLVSDAAASAGEWGQSVGVSHCAARTPPAGGVAECRDQRPCVPTLGAGWRRSPGGSEQAGSLVRRSDVHDVEAHRRAGCRSGAHAPARSDGCDRVVAGRRRRRQRAATTQPRATAAAVLSTAILCAAGWGTAASLRP